MIVRENGIVKVTIDSSDEALLLMDGYIIQALDLAESLDCECYAVNSDNVICASSLIYGKRCRIFTIREYKNKSPEIFFSDKFLCKDLINRYSDIVECTSTKNTGNNLMFKIEDLPLEVLSEFCKCVIKAREDSQTEYRLKRKKYWIGEVIQ